MNKQINRPVFLSSAFLIIIFSIYGAAFSEQAASSFEGVQSFLVTNFGWFYMGVVAVFFFFIIYLAFSRYGRIKLGPDDSEPEYSYVTWIAMLFSAGIGVGLMFFGVAEPMTHFASPPVGEGRTIEAAEQAMLITYFHWGLQAWATYILVGLALAYFAYRKGLPLTVSSALYPIIGDRIYGVIGNTVNVLAVLATMFGIATSLGLGVMQVNAGLNYLLGLEVSGLVQVLLIAFITAIATGSVVSGLNSGIRKLSQLNAFLAVLMLVFLLFSGPTALLLGSFIQNVGNYLSNMLAMSFHIYAYEPIEWMGSWTLFYWAWWISWSPFVGMFIARVSKGRTIREFVTCVLLMPVSFTFIWLSVFGNSAIFLELKFPEIGIAEAAVKDMPTALFVLLEHLPWTEFVSFIGILLIVIFFVTSSDSGSLVIDIITSNGREGSPIWRRAFWAIFQGVVASVLLLAGGLGALRTASISSAFPFAFVMLFICYGLYRGLKSDKSSV
ncbi:MAG: choline transporter [Gammaproteobacteria bacterium]|nr:choline transporter [Gammaproteobacteria bacterium]